jgi:hypothetical protein
MKNSKLKESLFWNQECLKRFDTGPSSTSLMDPSIPMSMLHPPPVSSHLIDNPEDDSFGVPPPNDGFLGSMIRAQGSSNKDNENEALSLTIKTEIDDGRIQQGFRFLSYQLKIYFFN